MTGKSENPVKKWIMLWMWRIQQIAQPVSLAMLAATVTLLVSARIDWRFENPYVGVLITFLCLVAAIALCGWAWDRKRMWHEQGVIIVERNPFMMEKMNPKEVNIYRNLWIPLLRALGENERADGWEEWVDGQVAADPVLEQRVETIIARYFSRKARK